MKQQVNLDIMAFVEQQILPRYNAFGRSHGLGHVQRVIKNSLQLAAMTGALRKWFSPEQIKIMKEAVEDHRASASHEPRSIYGKIVAEADRDLEPEVVFTRAILFGIEHNPELDEEGQWKRFDRHMEEKYSTSGYMRLWIPKSPNEEKLREVRETIADKARLRKVFDRIYRKETSEKD